MIPDANGKIRIDKNPNNNQSTFESLREDLSEDLEDIYDHEKNLAKNLELIFNESIFLPWKDVQMPIFLAYSLIPSALSTVCPIMFLHGERGSGKSTATILLSGLHQQKIMSAATTFAALRNHFQRVRWEWPETQEGEKNSILLFDNVNTSTLNDEKLYTLFLNGYNRRTDNMEISKGDGSNLVFKVFGPKVCSSIHALYSNPKFSEFARRLIVFKFKSISKVPENEIGNFDIHNRLEIEHMDLSLLHVKFLELWSIENSTKFMQTKKKISSRRKGFKIPKSIEAHQWAISIDLICAGLVSEVFTSVDDALYKVSTYWEWHSKYVASAIGAMQQALIDFIEERTAKAKLLNSFGEDGYIIPMEIECEAVKGRLDSLSSSGALETYPTPQTVTSIMNELGWTRQKGTQGEWCWVPVE